MKIQVLNGTIRVEDKSGSISWPLYMPIPSTVTSKVFKDVFRTLKIPNAGDPSIDFELCDGHVRVDGKEINPKSIPTHAKAVAGVIYAHDNGLYAELYDLRHDGALEDQIEMETVEEEVLEMVKGVPNFVTKEVTRKKANVVEIMRDGKGAKKFMQIDLVIKADKRKVARLAALETTVQNM